MKKLFSIIIALLTVSTAVAQTLNVKVGNVTYLFPASQAGEMTYSDGTNVSIMGKTLQLAEISEMSVNTTDVTDSRVDVSYTTSGASATNPKRQAVAVGTWRNIWISPSAEEMSASHRTVAWQKKSLTP